MNTPKPSIKVGVTGNVDLHILYEGLTECETRFSFMVFRVAEDPHDFLTHFPENSFLPNVLLLMISSKSSEFVHNQILNTCHLAHFACVLGIKVIFCVNKMGDEEVNFSEACFNEIKNKVSCLLKGDPEKFLFFPVSRWIRDNLVKTPPDMSWWNGAPDLFKALVEISVPPQLPIDSPLRISVKDVFDQESGIVAAGCVESGILKCGMMTTFSQPKPQ